MTTLDAEPLPEELTVVEVLIKDHQEFMEDMAKHTPEVDRVCKTKQLPISLAATKSGSLQLVSHLVIDQRHRSSQDPYTISQFILALNLFFVLTELLITILAKAQLAARHPNMMSKSDAEGIKRNICISFNSFIFKSLTELTFL